MWRISGTLLLFCLGRTDSSLAAQSCVRVLFLFLDQLADPECWAESRRPCGPAGLKREVWRPRSGSADSPPVRGNRGTIQERSVEALLWREPAAAGNLALNVYPEIRGEVKSGLGPDPLLDFDLDFVTFGT